MECVIICGVRNGLRFCETSGRHKAIEGHHPSRGSDDLDIWVPRYRSLRRLMWFVLTFYHFVAQAAAVWEYLGMYKGWIPNGGCWIWY